MVHVARHHHARFWIALKHLYLHHDGECARYPEKMGSLPASDHASVLDKDPVFETEIHHVSDGVGLIGLA
jgi:hypothetical protein